MASVYSFTCVANGKVYVGGTSTLVSARVSNHRSTLRSGAHRNKRLLADWVKFGEKQFKYEVLCECDIEDLVKREREFIDKLEAMNPDKGYNMRPPPSVCGSDVIRKYHGRKAEGRVTYHRRVFPDDVQRLDALLTGKQPIVPAPVVAVPAQVDTSQVRALLADVERLEAEVTDLKGRLERCAMATDDQKATYWMRRALAAEGAVKKSEFDQT